jgi:hypothetical protein
MLWWSTIETDKSCVFSPHPRHHSIMAAVMSTQSCLVCLEVLQQPLLCTGCRVAIYCSKEHQRQDWPRHKSVCSRRPGGATKSDRLGASNFLGSFEATDLFGVLAAVQEYVIRNRVKVAHNAFQLTRVSLRNRAQFLVPYPDRLSTSHEIFLIFPVTSSLIPARGFQRASIKVVVLDGSKADVMCMKYSGHSDAGLYDQTLERFFGPVLQLVRFVTQQPSNRLIIIAQPNTSNIFCAPFDGVVGFMAHA